MTPIALLAASVAIATTQVQLEPTDAPGAVAAVTIHNRNTNGREDNGEYTLELNGLTVVVVFVWNRVGDNDNITVLVPDGYVAVPRSLDVPEDTSGEILIYPMNTEAM